jgi:hypothetical protein
LLLSVHLILLFPFDHPDHCGSVLPINADEQPLMILAICAGAIVAKA